jgi:hypothetical protein
MKYIIIWHIDGGDLEHIFVQQEKDDLNQLHTEIIRQVEAILTEDCIPDEDWYIDLVIRLPEDTDLTKISIAQW